MALFGSHFLKEILNELQKEIIENKALIYTYLHFARDLISERAEHTTLLFTPYSLHFTEKRVVLIVLKRSIKMT